MKGSFNCTIVVIMGKSDLKTFLLKKKIGKVGLKKIIKVILVSLLVIYIPIASIAFISNLTTKSDNYVAILLSAHAFTNYDHWAPPIAFFGSYPAWTLYFNSKGLKTDYIFSATKKDFINVILDEKCLSIVLVGHGSYNNWQATDGIVGNFDIERLKGKFKKKAGEWFQLSCSFSDYSPIQLGEMVMENGKSYYYNGENAGTIDFVLDALFAFRHIKAEAEKRDRQ